jgi:hypothetical protein
MARLDEQFLFATDEPQQRTMRRLVATVENRLAAVEATRAEYDAVVNRLNATALARINEVLLPASERIVEYSRLGFLLAYSQSSVSLVEGRQALFIIDEGPQRELFTPTPFVAIQRQRSLDDYAIARVDVLDRASGSLLVSIVAAYGAAGPFDDWVISASPGVSEATRSYFERTLEAALRTESQAEQATADRDFISAVRQSLEEAGLNPDQYAWRDGSRPFTAVVRGVAPASIADDTTLPTSAWTRLRVQEALASLASGAPTALNTLAKLAAAIGNDPNFANVVLRTGAVANAAQLRAMTADRVIDTTALRTALNFRNFGTIAGNYTPDFSQFVNASFVLNGNSTLLFHTSGVSLDPLIGRSGLLYFQNNVDSTLSFATPGAPGTVGYTFDRMLAPITNTNAGIYNLFSYSIWKNTRIHLTLIGTGLNE